MSFLRSFFSCVLGEPSETPALNTTSDNLSSNVVTIILTSPTTADLHKSLEEQVSANGWTDALIQGILEGLTSAIRAGASVARPAADALKKATDAAVGFAKEHPAYATLIALGILFSLLPWVLEALGFAAEGVVAGSWAARWQQIYEGYVPRGALFGYFQRLGAKWHWM